MLSKIINLIEQGKYEKIKSLLNDKNEAKKLVRLFYKHPDIIFSSVLSSKHIELLTLCLTLLPPKSAYLRESAGLIFYSAYTEIKSGRKNCNIIACELMKKGVGYILQIPEEEKTDNDYRYSSMVLAEVANLSDDNIVHISDLATAITLRSSIRYKTHKDHVSICSHIVTMLSLVKTCNELKSNNTEFHIDIQNHDSIIYHKTEFRKAFTHSFQQITQINSDDLELIPEFTTDNKISSMEILLNFYSTYQNAHPLQNEIYSLAKYVFDKNDQSKRDVFECIYAILKKLTSLNDEAHKADIKTDFIIFLDLLSSSLLLNCFTNKILDPAMTDSQHDEAIKQRKSDIQMLLFKKPLNFSKLSSTNHSTTSITDQKLSPRYSSADNEIHCKSTYIASNSRQFKTKKTVLPAPQADAICDRKTNKHKRSASHNHK